MARRILPRRLDTGEEATLVEHLSELRHRLVFCLIALAPAFALAYAFHARLVEWLLKLLPEGAEIMTLGVTEPFMTSFKVSFYASIAIALPLLLWQVWGFLAPAVERSTQRAVSVFVVFSTVLFAAGIAFSYVVILPKALEFLVQFDSDLYGAPQIRVSYFLSFVSLTLIATGLAFQMPIFILALVRLGALSSAKLRKNRRWGMVAMIVFAIMLPTVDPVSLALEVVPLLILFESSIWLSAYMEKRWKKKEDAQYDEGSYDTL